MTAVLSSDDLSVNSTGMIIGICITLAFLGIYRSYRRPRTTKLRGPSSNNPVFGVTKELFNSPDLGGTYNNWEKTYGQAYEIPSILGSTMLVLQDPAAITHLYSKDTSTYHQIGFLKSQFKSIMTVSVFDGSCGAVLSRSFDGRPAMYC